MLKISLKQLSIDRELEVLTLQREADAAVVEAQVLENAKAETVAVEDAVL